MVPSELQHGGKRMLSVFTENGRICKYCEILTCNSSDLLILLQMQQICEVSSSWWTDRRHGQQVLWSHTDVVSKSVELVVTFSVELEELGEVTSHREQRAGVIMNHSVFVENFVWAMVQRSPSAWAQSNSGHKPWNRPHLPWFPAASVWEEEENTAMKMFQFINADTVLR